MSKDIEIQYTELAGLKYSPRATELKPEVMNWEEFRDIFFDPFPAEEKESAAYIPAKFYDKPKFVARPQNDKRIQRRSTTISPIHSEDDLGIVCYYPDELSSIDEISPNSPLAAAGMRSGNVITAVNGQEVSNMNEAIALIIDSMDSRPKIDYSIGAGAYRLDANVEKVYACVFDSDAVGAYGKNAEFLKGIESVVHSTFSYSSEKPDKFRFVMPFAEPVSREEWRICFKIFLALMEQGKIDIDTACGNLSRGYYMPVINPESDLSPVAYYNEGKFISKEMIYGWAIENNIDLSDALNSAASVKIDPADIKKRHGFGGRLITSYDQTPPPSMKYSSFEKRHESSIADLKTSNSRNTFVRDVFWNEIRDYGPHVDLDRLVYFVYEASTRYGTHGIHTSASNTDEEIPGLLIGAIEKLNSKRPNGLLRKYPEITKTIDRAVFSANKMALVPGKLLSQFDPEDKPSLKERDYFYSNILNRNSLSVNELKSGNISEEKFIKEIIFNEVNLSDKLPANIKRLSEFVYRFTKEEIVSGGTPLKNTVIGSRNDFPEAFAAYYKKCLEHCHPELANKMKSIDKMAVKMCKEANFRMQKGAWLKENEGSKSNGLEP